MKEFKVGDKALVEAEIYAVDGDRNYLAGSPGGLGGFWSPPDSMRHIQDKTYEDGIAEAWETARKLTVTCRHGGLCDGAFDEIFGEDWNFDNIFSGHTAVEAAAKIAAWERSKEIHAGDVVFSRMTDGTAIKGMALGPEEDEEICVIWEDRRITQEYKSALKKDGRAIDIAKLFRQIGGKE